MQVQITTQIPHPGPKPGSQRAQDLELAGRLCAGDESAYDELVGLYHRRVFAFALKRLGDATEAEDVAQDTFLQLYRSIQKYEGRSSLLTWIFGIAHHEVCNRFRRQRLETVPLEDQERELVAPMPGLESTIDALRRLDRCHEVLQGKVSPAQRRVFELRYWGARSIEYIAEETGKSPGAVRIGLLRTRRTLAEQALEAQRLAS
ncbi:MAG: RNA polymerase sigma factor [Myxococcota bacterium]